MHHDLLLDEIQAGEGLSLSRLARLCPATRRLSEVDGDGKPIAGTQTLRPVSLACVLRWVIDGVKLDDGTCVRLAAVRLAGKWISSAGALRRFIQAQTPAIVDDAQGSEFRTPGQRRRANARADKMLEKAGI
jgi:hypothetical protein